MTTSHYIAGHWVEGQGSDCISVNDPALGQPFAELMAASVSQVDQAVAAARSHCQRGFAQAGTRGRTGDHEAKKPCQAPRHRGGNRYAARYTHGYRLPTTRAAS